MEAVRKIGRQTFASLSIKNYRLYFIGQALSLSGTWMQTIAQDWLVLKITGSGTQLGIVSAFQFLPLLFFSPWGGVITDRFDKRKLLFITQTAAGILALILGILVATSLVKIWMVYLLALGLGFVNVIDNPTRQTFVSEMVDRDHLPNAITLNATEINMARAIGPAAAGIIISTLGLALCFFVNAVSYIAVIIILFLMQSSELHKILPVPRAKGQIREGLNYVKSSPFLLGTLLMMAVIGTFSYEFSISLPLMAQFVFHGDAESYAALVTAAGVGSVVGGLFTASRAEVTRKMLIASGFFFGVSLLITTLMPTLHFAMLSLFFAGFFSINFISLGNTMLQLESVPEKRGLVMSLWTMAFLGSTPIGGPIIGWIGEYIGPRWGLGVGGAAAVAAAAFGAIFLLKKDKAIPVPEEVAVQDERKMSEERLRI
ncbi:MAG: MFS transporter [Candidatus Moranbacteria bacterium]|nr:MFS transporter [Candidatus Moranbacteria bacterium]